MRDIRISDYDYALPEERIAKFPLAERDASKLLVYRDGVIADDVFRNLADHIPSGSLMVFNKTKVIPARLVFEKSSGARIEVLCLSPDFPVEYSVNLSSHGPVRWNCMIGNNKRWKEEVMEAEVGIGSGTCRVRLRRVKQEAGAFVVEFDWDRKEISFGELLEEWGKVPLPPYLNRDAEGDDRERYQTTYAEVSGSVAAPTAGLHFTPAVMDALRAKGIESAFVTLHVGAGTFKPVTAESVREHEMHAEFFEVEAETLRKIRDAKREGRKVIAVGTTSARTLESLHVLSRQMMTGNMPAQGEWRIGQWDAWTDASGAEDAAAAAERLMGKACRLQGTRDAEGISAWTSLMILPGHHWGFTDGIVTNFHQPKSTLMLLVAALAGGGFPKDLCACAGR